MESQAVTHNFFAAVEDLCTTELRSLVKEWRLSEEYDKAVNKLKEKDRLNVGLQDSHTSLSV
jgi:hypothetical protein